MRGRLRVLLVVILLRCVRRAVLDGHSEAHACTLVVEHHHGTGAAGFSTIEECAAQHDGTVIGHGVIRAGGQRLVVVLHVFHGVAIGVDGNGQTVAIGGLFIAVILVVVECVAIR